MALHRNSDTDWVYKGKLVLNLEQHNSVSPCVSLPPPESARTSFRTLQDVYIVGQGWLTPDDSSTGCKLSRGNDMFICCIPMYQDCDLQAIVTAC